MPLKIPRTKKSRDNPQVTPLWAKPAKVVELFGIPRYKLFEMLRDKEIRSTILRRPGSQRYMRLIDIESLKQALNRNATEAEPRNSL